ncbi:MAG: hypothetical protein WCF03_05145 [Nitrososphaeraceae archaeon]|jgi:hypothetical protein
MFDVDKFEEMCKLKTEDLISKTEVLKESSYALLVSNDALKLKTEELDKSKQVIIRIKP